MKYKIINDTYHQKCSCCGEYKTPFEYKDLKSDICKKCEYIKEKNKKYRERRKKREDFKSNFSEGIINISKEDIERIPSDTNNIYGCIYKIENKITHEVYIGKTTRGFKKKVFL